MKTIGIFFSTDSRIISRLIRLVTRSKVSHTGFIYYDETLDNYMIMHATNLGFNITPLTYFVRNAKIIAFYTPKSEFYNLMMLGALKHISLDLGKEYDYTGVLGFLFAIAIRRWFHIKFLNPSRDSSKMFCSEAVAKLIKHMDIGFHKDPETTSPEDLLNMMPNDHFILSEIPKVK